MPKVSENYLDERRRDIVRAARRLFARRGFAATSMADLVDATSLSMGTLYRYFPSKADLVLAVVDGRDGQVNGRFDEGETAAQLLRRLADYVTPVDTSTEEVPGNSEDPDDADPLAHARLTSHIWSNAAQDRSLAAVTVQRHSALRDDLAAKLAGRTSRTTPGTPTARTRADLALASLIGYSALIASGYPLDHATFVETLIADAAAP